ncbi:MAG: ATP-binding cassette domain-containing protein [Gammaproteobacteria bacterium]|nr:ATP-binding cassette domain-containing protein [Gammaproteobacteria bacterium]MDP2141607.1 ATP-binding cassette domain-containing protein [Gammaproteobacteria bacterium]MDP2346638.1 ATP-binding cassette domain-containing protein [Gammaproteobacteria bacterium]
MISLTNATLMRGELTLLQNASLAIHNGQKIGVIGRNGSGKSSLFACLLGQLALDSGELSIPDGMRCAHMKQETVASAVSAVDYVIDGDERYREIERKLDAAEKTEDGAQIAHWHSEMDKIGGYDIRYRAMQLLSGLGFSAAEFDNAVSTFSGGWRIRLNLAAALMAPSDLLLLDEPTNHLDMEATLWLEQWLNRYEGTLLIISHDRSFLDGVISYVVSVEQQRLNLYRGNYSSFELQRAERLAQEQAMFEKQQRRVAEIEDFVRRFRAKATKARQAQSRLKELDRMQQIAPAHIDSPFQFEFPTPDRLPDEVIALDKVSVGYDGVALVNNIRLTVRNTTRIGLLGFNGCGKSTLLRTMAGQLVPVAGEKRESKYLQVGYFAQHQVDVLDQRASPVLLIQRLDPSAREQTVRDFLGGFDFRGERINETIENFSGGEKARLALALVVWQKPNLLLLDEPTNHLDLEMRHALTVALQGFEGALVIVSHDRHLLSNTVDEFYSIHNGRCQEFDGDLHDYEKWMQENSRSGTGTASSAPDEKKGDRKEQRQQAAAQRQQLAPLRNEIRKLEQKLEKLHAELQQVEEKLADATLYEESRKKDLTTLLQKQATLKSEADIVEEQWLEKSEQFESLG